MSGMLINNKVQFSQLWFDILCVYLSWKHWYESYLCAYSMYYDDMVRLIFIYVRKHDLDWDIIAYSEVMYVTANDYTLLWFYSLGALAMKYLLAA